MAALDNGPFTVGFAAETQNVLEYADDKRRGKQLDMIAANQVGVPGSGFESEQNALHVLWEGGEKILPQADKTQLGHELIALSRNVIMPAVIELKILDPRLGQEIPCPTTPPPVPPAWICAPAWRRP